MRGAVPPPPIRVVTPSSAPVSSGLSREQRTSATIARIGVGTPITTITSSAIQAATGSQAINSTADPLEWAGAAHTRQTSIDSSRSEDSDNTAWRRAVIAMVDSMEGCSTDEVVTKMSGYLHGEGDAPQDESQELVRLWAAEVIAEVKARASKTCQVQAKGDVHGRELPRAWLQLGEELLLGARDGSKMPDLSPAAAATALQGPKPSTIRDPSASTLEQVLVSLEAGSCRHAELAAVVGALTQRVDHALAITNGDSAKTKDGSTVTPPSKMAEVSLDGEPNLESLARAVTSLTEEVRAIAASVSALSLRVDPLEVGRQTETPAAPQDTDSTGAAPAGGGLQDQKQDCAEVGNSDAGDISALLRSLREERELVTAMAHGLRHEKAEVLAALRGLHAERKEVIAEREALEQDRTAILEAAKDLRAARDAAAGAVIDLRNEHCSADLAAKHLQERLITLASAGAAAVVDPGAASIAEDSRLRAATSGRSEPAAQGSGAGIERVGVATSTGEANSKRPGSTSPFRQKRSVERNRPTSPPNGALPTGSPLPVHPATASNSAASYTMPVGVSAPGLPGASMAASGATTTAAKLVQTLTNGGSARLSGPGTMKDALLQQAAAAGSSPRSSSLGRSQAEGMRRRGVKSSVSPRNSPSPRDSAENREQKQRLWPPSRIRRPEQTTAGRTSLSTRSRESHPSWAQ